MISSITKLLSPDTSKQLDKAVVKFKKMPSAKNWRELESAMLAYQQEKNVLTI